MPDDLGRPSCSIRVGGISVCLRQLEDCTWSAWAIIGPEVGHESAQAAVEACLAACKASVGMKSHQEMARAFAGLAESTG